MTRLRCGGKYNSKLAADFLLSPAVKEFWKFVNICLGYARAAFWLTVYEFYLKRQSTESLHPSNCNKANNP